MAAGMCWDVVTALFSHLEIRSMSCRPTDIIPVSAAAFTESWPSDMDLDLMGFRGPVRNMEATQKCQGGKCRAAQAEGSELKASTWT